MKYKSKKDPNVIVEYDGENEKCKTTRLKYLTGEKTGKTFDVANTTLKRWWSKIEEKDENPLNLDYDKINEPYPEPKEQKYIPKPQAVIDYEENKIKKRAVCTFDMPKDYEQFGDILAERGVELKRVNTGYISLPDNSKLKLLKTGVGILASTDLAEKLAKCGLKSKPCIEKGTPFRFDACNQIDYDTLLEVLSE